MKRYLSFEIIGGCIKKNGQWGLLFFSVFLFQNQCRAQDWAFDHPTLTPTQMKASYDIVNQKEGGNSAITHDAKGSFNLALMWRQALGGASSGKNDVGDFLPSKPSVNSGLSLGETFQFIQKGSKEQMGGGKETLNYLEVLIDVIYHYNLSSGAVYGGLGPYIGYGIGGKFSGGGVSESSFGGTDGYKRFDAGLHGMVGYSFIMGLDVGVGYEFGLLNKAQGDSDFTSKNRAFSINVGYSLVKIFGKDK
jgi:hypothetical protein